MKLKYFFIILVMFLSIYEVFNISYKVQNSREDLAKIKSQIIDLENQLRILEVEWSYLNNPARIKKLSEKYLDLKIQKQADIKKTDIQLVFKDK